MVKKKEILDLHGVAGGHKSFSVISFLFFLFVGEMLDGRWHLNTVKLPDSLSATVSDLLVESSMFLSPLQHIVYGVLGHLNYEVWKLLERFAN